jgi:spermidine/putrescine transport system permease protein
MTAPTIEARPAGDVVAAAPPTGRRRRRPGRLGDFILRFVAGLVLVYLFIPIAVIVAFSFNDPSGKFNLTWRGFTLENWTDPFRYSQLTDALWTSLQVAALSTAVSIVLGTLVAVALVRQRFAGDRFVETFLVLPLTAPEIVMGASLLTLFLDLGWNRGFGTIIIAHIAFEVSFVALTVRARVRGLDWTLEDAAMDLGAPPLRTFALSLDDFIITYFNSGSTVTYPLYVNAATKAALPPQINVLATTILVVSLLLIGVITLWQRRRLRA